MTKAKPLNMKDKRKKTTYSILVKMPTDRGGAGQPMRLVGEVEAFTPNQARRRALTQIEAVQARAKSGKVTVLAVPVKSMSAETFQTKTKVVPA